MNTTTSSDEVKVTGIANSNLQLSLIREQKGYSMEYVANKLHLRVRIIELIENNEFHLLPEPVFVKGYLRAYAKLLGISPDPYLAFFNQEYTYEKNPERALWQSKRQPNKGEHALRWVTLAFAFGVMISVGIWWQKNKDVHPRLMSREAKVEVKDTLSLREPENKVKLTDIATMRSLLLPESEITPLETNGG